MPKSKVRQKSAYTPPQTRSPKKQVSPPWVGWSMVGCFLVGLVWLVLFYVTNNGLPIPAAGNWNLLIGFSFIIAGFGISTQWR